MPSGQRIADAGGDPARVRVVGVTKGFGPDAVRRPRSARGWATWARTTPAELVEQGRARRSRAAAATELALPRAPCSATRWRRSPRSSGVWQSVARAAEGERDRPLRPGPSVMVQVEATGCPGATAARPGGARPGDAAARTRARGRGLMTVAAPGPREAARGVVRDGGAAGRRPRLAGAFHGDERRSRGGRGGRVDHGAGRSGALRRAAAAARRRCCVMGVLRLACPPGEQALRWPGQEKVWHPRS